MRSKPLTLLATLLISGAAAAQLTTTPPFTGIYSEGFENPLPGNRILQNHASITPSPGGSMMVTYGWLLYVGYAVYPRGQSNSFLGTVTGHAVLTFDNPVQRFGAFFATVGYLAGGSARLYDDAHNLIDTMPLAAPRGSPWVWDGWDAGRHGPKIKSIEFVANDPYNGGALLCLEDAEVDVWLGEITTRPTGCGGLGIQVNGLPVVGDTLHLALTGGSAFLAFLIGSQTSQPIGPCPGCTLGASGVLVAGASYALDIPNRTSLLDLQFAVQGLGLGAGPCLNAALFSDTLDVRVGQ